MSFTSEHADKIWNRLYRVYIPDLMTQNPDYIKKFGAHLTRNRAVDEMVKTNLILVMIPVIKIPEYFEDGIEIQIPSREDMITMHKHIELYLEEWKHHIKYDINTSLSENKELILSLEKLSAYIYNKAKPREVVDNLISSNRFGLVSPLAMREEQQREVVKPDYEGIGKLVKTRTKPREHFE